MAKVPELKGGQMITIAYFIGILVILFIVYKILAATGLVKTAASKKIDAAENAAVDTIRTSDIFDPEYAREKGRKFLPLGTQKLAVYTEELRKALRGWGTDEEAIFVVFGNLYNKVNVSELAATYYDKYKVNLKTVLLNDLSKEDAATLMAIINKLPNN